MTASFNLGQRLYIDEDGTLCEITNMYDSDGDETEESDRTVVIVVKRSDTEWLTVNVTENVTDARTI